MNYDYDYLYNPADEISQKLVIATNLVAGLYIACTELSWLTGAAILVAANVVPVIEAVVAGTATRRLHGNRSWSNSTAVQWNWSNDSATLFHYPTISPRCIPYAAAEAIVAVTRPLNNN